MKLATLDDSILDVTPRQHACTNKQTNKQTQTSKQTNKWNVARSAYTDTVIIRLVRFYGADTSSDNPHIVAIDRLCVMGQVKQLSVTY